MMKFYLKVENNKCTSFLLFYLYMLRTCTELLFHLLWYFYSYTNTIAGRDAHASLFSPMERLTPHPSLNLSVGNCFLVQWPDFNNDALYNNLLCSGSNDLYSIHILAINYDTPCSEPQLQMLLQPARLDLSMNCIQSHEKWDSYTEELLEVNQ